MRKSVEERRAYHREWCRTHPENMRRAAVKRTKWAKENPDKIAAIRARYIAKNPRAYVDATLRWQKRNPEKISISNRKRKALRREQTHPQIDWREVEEMALLCWRMTVESGITWHVDHIIPLNSGGWHHHDNLQILPDRLNILKSDNPFWECEGYKSWRDVPTFLWPEHLVSEYLSRLI